MKILKVNTNNPDQKIIELTVRILTNGGLIVYPTDTAYGLGGNALDEKVIRKVYELKDRDFKKPTHVTVHNWKMINKLTFTNDFAKELYVTFTPGPLTIILNKKSIVPDMLTAGLPTLGVRIPKLAIIKRVSNFVDFPFTTPSANRSGGVAPYSISDVKKELDIEKVDLILDAGELPKVLPSTIIDLTLDPPKILRQGPISRNEIEKVLGIEVLV
ncbi:threonylcarbamoyl-AMP synthase [Candidatus Woesebacteria bacterium RIFCSPHIGHO2_01_FULL_39_32]|uniref:L-threonylcarbamoyladenylate synthase n=2 Tax=Candidatus Woeseibacteriota TaxID=1752722 RepID=A0A0G0SVD4_9BACT|nr:MAG: Translation factor SUA5 [Candidatus Woesebacteria bacterium GW2011_GWA1_39_8]OGM04869.1 MAG: threonylcarbamoyl-AMP synthase [Candidatus Woesebacteria bacterium GWB1_37_5]OGM25033.1 MAG: threonylcarbamoyl-AMP synthase [Candidatus Woesebacteria bacterium RIFCSPHIGHO2_01_FULL_39_32]OGM36621.1 MAG: threonylcarbamoyl-AMP synthase [Candidatus Woesebacteria bacterium RIFCSPHIGHO2_12_FULL_38_11]OGM63948.1 MAG: threonylcarbamoyl-AMP synthase [Candidatus Woesebacteria bacterium RIFCSPLOWO2_01_FUL